MNTAKKPLVRAGCYCRISSDPKDKREGTQRQREDTTALCEVKGWEVADMYVDDDRSASNGKPRPEWERLLADIEAGKIDAVAAWDQDRVNRMMDDFQRYKKLFVARGILLATSNNGDIDLTTPSGVLTATIKTAVSEHEVAMMKIRMRRAARGKAEKGIPQWKRAFGYLDETHQPDPETAPLVAQAYAAVLAGGSITDVAKAWNEAKAYGLNGKPWSPSTVSLFLRAPRNAGLRAHNGEVIGDGKWPPLVPKSTWKSVQAVLDGQSRTVMVNGKPQRVTRPGRKSVQRHLLTGLLRCGKPDCDGVLGGNWQKHKTTGGKPGRPKAGQVKELHSTNGVAHRLAYSCKSCHGVSIRAEHIEPLLYKLISGRLAMPDAVDLLKAEIHDEVEAEAIRTELNSLHTELRNIGVERGKRLLTGEQAKVATDLINEEIVVLERRQQDDERLRVLADIPLGKPEVTEAIAELSPDRFRAVVSLLLTVTVLPVGKGSHAFDPERVTEKWISN